MIVMEDKQPPKDIEDKSGENLKTPVYKQKHPKKHTNGALKNEKILDGCIPKAPVCQNHFVTPNPTYEQQGSQTTTPLTINVANPNDITPNVFGETNNAIEDIISTFQGASVKIQRCSQQELRSLSQKPLAKGSSEVRLRQNCLFSGLEYHGTTPGDGNCFFHAIADQMRLHNLPSWSANALRSRLVHWLKANPNFQGPDGQVEFKVQVENRGENFHQYCTDMVKDRCWADDVAVFAMAYMLQYNIMIITSSPQATENESFIRWIPGNQQKPGRMLLLGHRDEDHYQSLEPIANLDKVMANMWPTPQETITKNKTPQQDSSPPPSMYEIYLLSAYGEDWYKSKGKPQLAEAIYYFTVSRGLRNLIPIDSVAKTADDFPQDLVTVVTRTLINSSLDSPQSRYTRIECLLLLDPEFYEIRLQDGNTEFIEGCIIIKYQFKDYAAFHKFEQDFNDGTIRKKLRNLKALEFWDIHLEVNPLDMERIEAALNVKEENEVHTEVEATYAFCPHKYLWYWGPKGPPSPVWMSVWVDTVQDGPMKGARPDERSRRNIQQLCDLNPPVAVQKCLVCQIPSQNTSQDHCRLNHETLSENFTMTCSSLVLITYIFNDQ